MTTLFYIRVEDESCFLLLYVLFIYDFQLNDTIESPSENHLFTSLANPPLYVTDLENVISENTH